MMMMMMMKRPRVTCVEVLAEEPNTHVIIMSSLEQDLLAQAIGSLPCWIIAEGGVCYREPDGTWSNMEIPDKEWLAPAKESQFRACFGFKKVENSRFLV